MIFYFFEMHLDIIQSIVSKHLSASAYASKYLHL